MSRFLDNLSILAKNTCNLWLCIQIVSFLGSEGFRINSGNHQSHDVILNYCTILPTKTGLEFKGDLNQTVPS